MFKLCTIEYKKNHKTRFQSTSNFLNRYEVCDSNLFCKKKLLRKTKNYQELKKKLLTICNNSIKTTYCKLYIISYLYIPKSYKMLFKNACKISIVGNSNKTITLSSPYFYFLKVFSFQ